MGIFSLNQFCQRLSDSGFVDPETADARIDQWREESQLSEDERKLADWLIRQGALTPFQAETLLLGLTPPYVLGDWKLQELIAAGRLGNLFKAVNTSTGAAGSLKIFPPGLRRDPLKLARMRREARVAVQLDHPHIVRTRSLGQHEDFTFLVLEPLEGETLSTRLDRESRLSWKETARLGAEAALGLQYLHGRGIVHRDVQPGNLWIRRDGMLEVMEFGAARDALEFLESSDSGVGLSELGGGSIVGTFDYMAPEQAQDSHAADARSDLYSLGCVLYHCLTGHPPFPDSHPVRQMLRHANERPEPIEKSLPDAAPGVCQIVMRLLGKRPEDRPSQADQVAEVLNRALGGTRAPAPRTRTAPENTSRTVASVLVAEVEPRGTAAVLHVSTASAVSPSPLSEVLSALDEAVRAPDVRRVILDLKQVSLLTSSGVATLIAASQKLRDTGVALKLAAVPPNVQSILAITQLTRLFDIAPTVDAAIGEPGQPPKPR
jgi:anti-anti-sigma factor